LRNVTNADSNGDENYTSIRFSQHEIGSVPANSGPHSPGIFWTFVIGPPNVIGELTAEGMVNQLNAVLFFINFDKPAVNRRRADTNTSTYLELNALFFTTFDPNAPAPTTTRPTVPVNITIATSGSTTFSNDIALIVGICGGIVLLLLIIAVLYTRKNLSAASSKITSLKTRKFVRVMAPAKTVWDPANMGDWWTVSPTGEKPFHFFPSLWDPDNVEDWWTMAEMSNDPVENMGYKSNPNFLEGADAAAMAASQHGSLSYLDPALGEGADLTQQLEGFWN
jgi:hypothetical protein